MDFLGIGLGAVGQGLNMIGQKKRYDRSVRDQKKMMDIQFQNQKQLNEQGQELAMKTWEQTNAPAQMAMLEEAGLNPALMYGGSGPGGTTASGSGGGASGGSAPGPQPMEIGQALQAIGMQADIELKKATARETKARAEDQEISNEVRKQYGKDADIYEASNRRDKALSEGQYLFEDRKADTPWLKQFESEIEGKNIDTEIKRLEKRGIISDNEVKAYKAKLAKAGIDPDSNPIIRELMKAMAGAGVPLNKLLENAVRFFISN